ncbi:MAG: zinc ribbon domain-containing protein [Thermoplasmata archaeon]|nr:zinc ribbon domain-containing protein [Thermoplasmata archaeon]
MSNDSLNRLMAGFSIFWILFCILRVALYSSAYTHSPQGQLFTTILNIVLIVGILLMAVYVFRILGRRAAARTMKSTHCQQCFAKLPPDQDFCPQCGWRREDR